MLLIKCYTFQKGDYDAVKALKDVIENEEDYNENDLQEFERVSSLRDLRNLIRYHHNIITVLVYVQPYNN